MIENSQENNKSKRSLTFVAQNLSNSSRRDSIDLFVESDYSNVQQRRKIESKDYNRESLDLFDESYEHTKISISVNVGHKDSSGNISNKSVSDTLLAELINIKTPKETEDLLDCNNGGESILELSQRDFGTRKRKRDEDPQIEKETLINNFLEPQLKQKKFDEITSTLSKTRSGDMFEGTMFPDSLIIDTQLEQLLNNNEKTNSTYNVISKEMSESIMQVSFKNSFNLITNTIICPDKSNIIETTCKDLVISDSEDMIAGSQDTMSSGASPRKYVFLLFIYSKNYIREAEMIRKTCLGNLLSLL